ncbi:unnamed protein product [Rotaria sp. Silwood2]|nr:unnamed protein product [Rotaria sp. Silwood2]CAF4166425.1 unnamed protein product [Rotaria sp. Silwood2]
MGLIHYKHGRYKLALKYYSTAFYILKILPSDITNTSYGKISDYVGMMYFEYGQLMEARQYSLDGLKIFFSNGKEPLLYINTYINLGLIECKIGNYYVALDYFGQAADLFYNQNRIKHATE